MTAINFPASPKNGDTFVNGDVTYTWDGVKWTAKGADPGHVKKSGDTMTGNLTVPSLNGGPLAGFRNRFINGGFEVDQRHAGASHALPVGNSYGADRWFVGTDTAPCTGQRIGGSGSYKNAYRITGAAGNTAVYISQRIEADNIYDLASKDVVVTCRLAASAITSVTWTAFAPNAENDFSGTTQVATGTIPGISGAAQNFTFTFNAGPDVVRGLQITFNLGAMPSGTLDITGLQLEAGTVATPFEHRPYGTELALCRRYYQRYSGPTGTGIGTFTRSAGGTASGINFFSDVPLGTVNNVTTKDFTVTDGSANATQTGLTASVTSNAIVLNNISTTGLSAGLIRGRFGSADSFIAFDGEL